MLALQELQEQCSAFIINVGCLWIVAFSVTVLELTHSKSLKIQPTKEGGIVYFNITPYQSNINASEERQNKCLN